jgi:hypothetical protein
MRTFDADLANSIYGIGDLSALVNDRRNIILVDGDNLAIFAWRGPGIYEAHLHFTARGRQAITLACEMLRQVDAKMIWSLIPIAAKNVRWFSRQIGFRSLGEMESPEGLHELIMMEI